MCIPRVFRVRALRLWCVYFGLVGGILEGDWLLRLVLAGFFGACEWRGFGVSMGKGLGGFGYVSGIWGLGVVLGVLGLRTWAVGDGFHGLHWNMLSWFGFCTKVFRGFLFWWGVPAGCSCGLYVVAGTNGC